MVGADVLEVAAPGSCAVSGEWGKRRTKAHDVVVEDRILEAVETPPPACERSAVMSNIAASMEGPRWRRDAGVTEDGSRRRLRGGRAWTTIDGGHAGERVERALQPGAVDAGEKGTDVGDRRWI